MPAAAVSLAQVRAKLDGVAYGRHAILTCGGTWAPVGVGYASDTVARADPTLVYEIPVPGPQSFGPIGGGDLTAPSYQQSVTTQYQNGLAIIGDLAAAGLTFGVWGYSQGAQVVSMLAMAIMTGPLAGSRAAQLFIGGGTYGNPYRLADSVPPGWDNPGLSTHGIAPVNMTPADIKYVNGQLAWADYANVADLYTTAPKGQVGVIEADAYRAATGLQFNNMQLLAQDEINACLQILSDAVGGLKGVLGQVLSMGIAAAIVAIGVQAIVGLITGLVAGPQASATGVQAAAEAAINGIEFLAQQPPTAAHISYAGENGRPDAVGAGAMFLNHIALLTTATAA